MHRSNKFQKRFFRCGYLQNKLNLLKNLILILTPEQLLIHIHTWRQQCIGYKVWCVTYIVWKNSLVKFIKGMIRKVKELAVNNSKLYQSFLLFFQIRPLLSIYWPGAHYSWMIFSSQSLQFVCPVCLEVNLLRSHHIVSERMKYLDLTGLGSAKHWRCLYMEVCIHWPLFELHVLVTLPTHTSPGW